MQQEPNKLQQLYGLYEENDLLGGAEYELFEKADNEQRKQLFELAASNGVLGDVDFETFNSAWDVKKKDDTQSPSPSLDGSATSTSQGPKTLSEAETDYFRLSPDLFSVEKRLKQYESFKDENGQLVLESQEQVNQYNSLVNEFNQLVKAQNNAANNYKSLLTEDNIRLEEENKKAKEQEVTPSYLGRRVLDFGYGLTKGASDVIKGVNNVASYLDRLSGYSDDEIQEHRELLEGLSNSLDMFAAKDLDTQRFNKEEEYSKMIAQGFGNMYVFMLGGGSIKSGAALGAFMNAGANTEEAKTMINDAQTLSDAEFSSKYNVPEDKLKEVKSKLANTNYEDIEGELILKSTGIGLAEGSVGLIGKLAPVAKVVGKINAKSGGKLAESIRKIESTVGGRAVSGAVTEAIQETGAQLANNAVAKDLYDEVRDLSDGTPESALVGGVIGGVLGAFKIRAREVIANPNSTQQEQEAASRTLKYIANKEKLANLQSKDGNAFFGKEYSQLQDVKKELQESLEQTEEQVARDAINEEISKIESRSNEILKESNDTYQKMSEDDKLRVDEIDIDLGVYKKVLDAETTEGSKKVYQDRIKSLINERESIEDKYKGDVQQTEAFSETEQKVESEQKPIVSPETSRNYANLTEDNEGNFVFFHKGRKGFNEIKPSSGKNKVTSREEASALGKVGGLAMYYTQASDQESGVIGDATYAVKLPKEQVYDFNSDPNNYIEEAKKRHKEEHPNKAFDVNTQVAYVTKIAGENGYKMVVSEWRNGTRAQTTEALSPDDVQLRDGNTITQDFTGEFKSNRDRGYVPEDRRNIEGEKAKLFEKIQKVAGDNYSSIEYKLGKLANYNVGDKFVPEFPNQKTVDKAIAESKVIPQELKDRYKELQSLEELPARSIRNSIVSNPVKMPSAPKDGVFLDIEMIAGKGGRRLTEQEIINALPFDEVEVDNDGTNLRVKIPREMTSSEMMSLMEATEQEAIGQVVNGEGRLFAQTQELMNDYGGAFNPEYFKLPKKTKKVQKEPSVQQTEVFTEREQEVESEQPTTEETQPTEIQEDIRLSNSFTKPSNTSMIPIDEAMEYIGEDRVGDEALPLSRERIDELKEDIKKNGLKEALIMFYNNGEASIIEGNHRIQAMKELGYSEVPVELRTNPIPSRLNRKETPIDAFQQRGSYEFDQLGITNKPFKTEDYAIQERETTEVPSEPEAQPIQEMEGEVRGGREGQEGTQEGRIEDAGQTQEEGVVLKYQETTTPEQFSEVDGGERVFKEAAGVFNKALDRRQGEQVATEDALNYIQKTKAYENANDTQREEMVRAFRNELGIKEKRTPSAKKVLGEDKQKPPTKEYTNTQINRLAEEIDKRGIKEGQRRAKIKEKEFTEAVKDVLKTVPKGEMSTNQAAILSNRAKSVRTPYQLRKFLQYADKVMNDAEYASKLNKAESVQDKIKTFSKQKDKPSNITSFAKEFSVIDPSSVPDIDQYLLYAERVLNLNRKPKVTKNGLEESPMYVSINEIRTEYLDRYKAMTDGDLKQSILDDHNDLVELGVIDSKMTPNELNEIIESIYSEEQDESKSDDRKIKTLKKLVDYKIMEVSEMPTDGLSIKAKEQIDLIKSADLDKIPLSSQKLANLYASLENYVYNGSLNNLSSITADIYSANAHKELSDYFKETGNSPKKWVSKFKNLALGALNMTQILEALRASSEAGALTYEKSALYEMSAKKTNAENRISKVSEEYANRFINRSNKKLTDAVTSVEERTDRMMYGLLSQVPQQDFKEALDYIEQSIDYQLQDSNSNVVEMAEGAKKVFDKKYKNANNINDIKISKESEYILSWFRDKFAEIKPEYFENAEIVHNRTLEESPNYLPFPSRAKQGVESKSSEETLDQPSNLFDKVILPNRSGATNKRKNTFNPKARYMPLDFEAEMFSQYTNQVMDIETSFTIKKIAAFLRNSESVNVFGDRSMQKAFFDRAKEYVNQSFESNEMGATENTVFKMLNYASNLSGRVALGGVDQAAKQFVPVVLNAGVNAGFDNVFDGLVALTNGSGAELISKTPVSRRAYTDQDTKRIYSTIPDASKKKLKNKLKNMFKVTDAAAEKLMMYVIQASDKAGAQASFLAYYKDFRGDNFKGFEQEGKNPNKEALAFADLMINNTQNVNDIDQQARWLRVKNKDYSSLLRKGMFPFVSFRVNQIGDEVVQLSKFKSKGKRWEAAKRLGGRIGEQLAFEAIRKGIYMFYGTASSALLYALTGIEATEEEKEDEKFISEKNAYSVGTATALNQLPFYGLSGTTDNIMNKKVNKYYFYHVLDPKEREKYTGYISPRLSDFEKTKKLNRGFLRWSEKAKSPLFVDRPDVDGIDLGALTIGAENHFNGAQSMWDIYHPLMNDKEFVYTSRSGNQTELDLTEEEKQALAIFAIMENSDLFLPNDIAKIATKSKRKLFNKKFREMYGD